MGRKTLIVIAVLGVLLGVLCVVIYFRPDTFTVRRSASMAAPPSEIFALVNDLQAWDSWSPWAGLDPHAKMTLSNPSAGKGASVAWSGNEKIGEGRLTILESKPDELVDVEQAFIRPLEGRARMVFTFTPEGAGTRVTWRMDGTNSFVGKAVCLFMDMDAILGKNFEDGLARMKTVVEKRGATTAAPAS